MLKKSKYAGLVENGIISKEDLNSAISKASSENKDIENIFLNEMKLSREEIGKSLQHFYKVPYQTYDGSNLPDSIFSGLNKNFLRRNNWVPLEDGKNSTIILIDDPSDEDKIDNIPQKFSKKKIEFRVGLKSDIHDFLNNTLKSDEDTGQISSNGAESSISALISELKEEQFHSSADADEFDEVSKLHEAGSAIVRLVNRILTDAYQQGASDIHFEPGAGKKKMSVRFRKDGICKVYQTIPYIYKFAIISRIKIMAKLNIAEKRLPQDGKILMRHKQGQIECRVATLPTVGGNEDAVVRILADSKPIAIAKMNFSKRDLDLIQEKVKKPYGLILAVGPTGSGKTTTLHSCLGSINTPDKKIWTAEDPVEITQDGLRQVQMLDKIGLNFSVALRSFLRGDPDVIMVGEMRDVETAQIGIQASLTGHLVLSTVHTNSAIAAITRLRDMGIESFLLASSLRTIISQRLVRRLCLDCKKEEVASTQAQKLFNLDSSQKVWSSIGCSSCSHTGYQGRIAIAECIQIDKELKELIHNNASENAIANHVFKENKSIDDASLELLKNGTTSCEELIRVGNLKEDVNI